MKSINHLATLGSNHFRPVLKTPGKPENKTILSNIVQKVPVFIVDIQIAIA